MNQTFTTAPFLHIPADMSASDHSGFSPSEGHRAICSLVMLPVRCYTCNGVLCVPTHARLCCRRMLLGHTPPAHVTHARKDVCIFDESMLLKRAVNFERVVSCD